MFLGHGYSTPPKLCSVKARLGNDHCHGLSMRCAAAICCLVENEGMDLCRSSPYNPIGVKKNAP